MSVYCDCKRAACAKCYTDCPTRDQPVDNRNAPFNCCVGCPTGQIEGHRQAFEAAKCLTVDECCCGKGYCGVHGQGGNGSGDCCKEETIPEKLIFVLEWYENGSDLIKKYVLIYYMVDGTTEIKDIINHHRFLRRMKVENINLDVLYLENVLNIYGRKMTITEYADSCTHQYLFPRWQKAFLLIKPHAVQCFGKILQEIEDTRCFKVLRARMACMTPDMVAKFYEHYKSEEFYGRMFEQMISGPVVAFLLIGPCAIQKLKCMAGDLDPAVAIKKQPRSFRGVYGKELALNAVHVSESPACVERDSSLFFTTCRLGLPCLAPGTALFSCSTCCIIKPHTVKDGYAGIIIDSIARANFKITAFELFYLDRSHAEEFYEIYKGVLSEYSDMTEELAIGPCYVMEISGCGEETQPNFREFVGPMDPVIARKLRPCSLRAKYGCTKVKNAVHCTDLCQDAGPEVDYFFRILQQTGQMNY